MFYRRNFSTYLVLFILFTPAFHFFLKIPYSNNDIDISHDSIESLSLKSSSPATIQYLWNKTWGDTSSNYISCITLDTNGSIYTAGISLFTKLDSSGNILYNVTVPYYMATKILVDSIGDIYITGYSNLDMWLAKYTNEGINLWNITWDSGGEDYSYDMCLDSDNYIYIFGEALPDGINPDYCLIKFNPDGIEQWNKTWDDPYLPLYCRAMEIDSNDNIYVAGVGYQSQHYYYQVFKLNSSGSMLWNYNWEHVSGLSGYDLDMICDPLDNIYLGGARYIRPEWLPVLIKINSNGTLQWDFFSNSTTLSSCWGIASDNFGNFYFAGDRWVGDDYDMCLLKFNSSGSLQEQYIFGDTSRQHCRDIIINSKNEIFLGGTNAANYCVVKLRITDIFDIINPYPNQLFGVESPSFILNFTESQFNKTWYTINNSSKHFFQGNNGVLNQETWNLCGEGSISILFFANDTHGAIYSKEVIVFKDITEPNIVINDPILYQLYGNHSPSVNIFVNETNLDQCWYTLDNGINNYTFMGDWFFINQNAWDNCMNGSVDITFYANDLLGHIGSKTISVYKDIDAPYLDVIKPEVSNLYGKVVHFEVAKYGNNINSTWYTINNGPLCKFNETSGILYQNFWNSTSDGLVILKFFINDSYSREVCTNLRIFKDATDPNISINLPLMGELFGSISPSYETEITDVNLNSTWYTLDNGFTNFTISNNIGIINQSAWSSQGDGNISIRFYANDFANNIAYKDVVVQKDTISPKIEIENPIQHQLFLDEIPEFNVSISDPNLNETWYTLYEGARIYFNESIGSIDQQVWESCNDGNVNITFWANDFAGNVAHESVIIRKNIDSKEAYAIIIGISNYPGSNNDLSYCDDDAIAVYNMLINDYNFKPANIIYLQDSSSTKADISNAFDTISSLADPNDVFFFYYSGHGGQGTFTTQGNWNVETLHPYWNNYDQIWSVSHPGALYMRVHFERFQTDDYYDYALCGSWSVTQGYYYEELTGDLGYNFWTSYIPVSRYYIRFISDSSNPFPYYGFKIDKYEAILSDGTHYLCSYDSIPSNPGAYYMDTLLDSKLDSISCADKYVVVDACNSGGLIPEVGDIGRYIMTACGGNEESLETSLLEHGIFTYFLLEANDNANDDNSDGVISMEECYSYVYSNTRSYSGSFGSEYRYSPQESDGISGEAVLYPSLGSLWINPVDNQLSYSFHLYGHGRLKTLNLTVCSISPTITLKTTNIMNVSTSPTGFGYYNGTIDLPGGYIAGGIQLLAEIEGNTIIVINITIGDSDEDGLTDFFEILEGLDPNSNDTDSDGLLDGEEINIYGTNPLLDDTDFDGLTDSDEINIHNTDPLLDDTDSDGVLDGEEINVYGTDPLIEDSDSDGLIDGDEINLYLTDPLNNDTDSDNLLDSEEILVYYTDPLNDDTDIDGLTDYDEIHIHTTDPLLNDTDSEGLTDGDEVNIYSTNPLLEDTDGDGLTDYEEVIMHNTNPLNSDTDYDTIPDEWEVDNLLDPLINDTALDPDNDLLTNLGEYQYSTQPFNNDTDSDGLLDGDEVYTYNTEPLEEDTDSDGLLDGEEVTIYNTEPLQEDTDSDGLLDGEEIHDYNTNPLSGDTDSDTMPDGWEVTNLLNPLVNDTALDPDNDLLINILEYQHNTDPQNPDTDGDSWTDGDEVLEYDTDPLDPDDHPSRKSPAIPGYNIDLLVGIISVIALIRIIKLKKNNKNN